MTTPAVRPPDPPDDLAAAIERVRSSGGRVTRAKREVAGVLFAADAPLTAEGIVELSGLEQSVVYRTLGQFESLGIVEHVHLGHGRAVYRRRGLDTVLVTCVGCGSTVEVDTGDLDDLARRVSERTGITLDLVHLPLSGRCRRCLRAD